MAEKILLLNGSPKKERSGSLLLARAFLDGLTAHGDFETETVHISALNIKPCLGCLTCWAREDATCVITDDDIPAVRKKIERLRKRQIYLRLPKRHLILKLLKKNPDLLFQFAKRIFVGVSYVECLHSAVRQNRRHIYVYKVVSGQRASCALVLVVQM